MDRRQICLTLLLIATVDILRFIGVFEAVWEAIITNSAAVGKTWVLQRLFPDGLLSLGAIIVLKDHLNDRIRTAVNKLRLWLQDGTSAGNRS